MSFHDELVQALIGRRIGQGRLSPNFAANLPRRQALPQPFQGRGALAGNTGPAQLPQPFQGGAVPGQVPFQLQPGGLFGISPQRQSLGDFSQRFRPLSNPPAPAPVRRTSSVSQALVRSLGRRRGGAASEGEGGPGGQGR